ncbi:helix-turn-helix domain-containing protein [Desulfovibrio sp. JC022]|uniref:helix-turn-helix domain-containing protein n=1 Tax=Desulfovibrio sp. JC022 TaxID=2593642 RepID=UPI0013CF78B2|nr:helix-turn-helix domain-containing protein [Desulfovibrio sp. JC022]NDV22800.1 helix-turn-helix domain-containing protein [Desulfovibrio sp. JC022]
MGVETVSGSDVFPDMEGRRAMSAEGLISVLGKEAAERLMYFWGGTRVSVPDLEELQKLRLRERIFKAYDRGATPAQIAERFGISVRTAQRIRNFSNYVERDPEIM